MNAEAWLWLWFTLLGQMGRSLLKKQLWILHTSTARCMFFDFTLSAEQAHEVEAIEGVRFHGFGIGVGIGADDEIVNGSFQYENRVVNSYELKTLPDIMKELGHDWVHVLKMDIEGAEYEVLPSIMTHYAEAQQAVPVTQAQVEYHHWAGRPSTEQLLSTLRLVEEGGFRLFHSEFNCHGEAWNFIEYASLHLGNEGHVVSPTELGPYHVKSSSSDRPSSIDYAHTQHVT